MIIYRQSLSKSLYIMNSCFEYIQKLIEFLRYSSVLLRRSLWGQCTRSVSNSLTIPITVRETDAQTSLLASCQNCNCTELTLNLTAMSEFSPNYVAVIKKVRLYSLITQLVSSIQLQTNLLQLQLSHKATAMVSIVKVLQINMIQLMGNAIYTAPNLFLETLCHQLYSLIILIFKSHV